MFGSSYPYSPISSLFSDLNSSTTVAQSSVQLPASSSAVPVTNTESSSQSFSPFFQFQSLVGVADQESTPAAATDTEQISDRDVAQSATKEPQESTSSSTIRKSSKKRSRPDDDSAGTGDRVRYRVSKACAACRKAHTSCDFNRPCSRCVKFGIPCEEPEDTGKRRGGARPRKKQKAQVDESSPASVEATTKEPTVQSMIPSDTSAQTQEQPRPQPRIEAQTQPDARDEEILRLKLELAAANIRRKGLEYRLEVNEKSLSNFLTDGADVPIIVMGQEDRVLIINEVLRQRIGLPTNFFFDTPVTWDKFVEPKQVPSIKSCVQEAVAKQRTITGLHVLVRSPHGTYVNTYIEVFLAYDPLLPRPTFAWLRLHFME